MPKDAHTHFGLPQGSGHDLLAAVEAIFFDIGDTLATARIDAAGALVLEPLPGATDALTRLSPLAARMGLISNTAGFSAGQVDAALGAAGLLEFFEPLLRIYSSVVGFEKDSPVIFHLAAGKAGTAATPAACLFVGEKASERAFAEEAGMRSVAGLEAALALLSGGGAAAAGSAPEASSRE